MTLPARTRRWRAPLLVALAAALAACAPPCREVCRKLERCETQPGVTYSECLVQCDRILTDARDLEDDVRLDRFNDHRRCLGSSTCDEIDEGVCYDPELFPFDEG